MVAIPDLQQHGIAQASKRTASFHPVGRVQDGNFIAVVAAMQAGDEQPRFFGCKDALDISVFFLSERPEPFAARNGGAHILNALGCQMTPLAMQRLLHCQLGRFHRTFFIGRMARWFGRRLLIALHHLLHHLCGGDARQIGAASGGCQRQGEPDQIMGGIADDGLVHIADLDFHVAFNVSHGSEIARMTVPADPYRWPLRQLATAFLQPLIKPGRIAAHIGMRRGCHFQSAARFQNGLPLLWF